MAAFTRRDAFTEAYGMVRHSLRSERWRGGDLLILVDIARELGLSATPVREAVSRLVGEGMIEYRKGQGYFVPRPAPADLRELYGFLRLVLLAALAHTPQRAAGSATLDSSSARGIFVGIGIASGDRLLTRTIAMCCDRLAPVGRAEALLFADTDEELDALRQSLRLDALDIANDRVRAYFDRRLGEVARIAAVRDQLEFGGQDIGTI